MSSLQHTSELHGIKILHHVVVPTLPRYCIGYIARRLIIAEVAQINDTQEPRTTYVTIAGEKPVTRSEYSMWALVVCCGAAMNQRVQAQASSFKLKGSSVLRKIRQKVPSDKSSTALLEGCTAREMYEILMF
jgi:hypothetical protein